MIARNATLVMRALGSVFLFEMRVAVRRPCVYVARTARGMWARAAVLAWPAQADDIHRQFFSAQPYTHLHIHPIFLNDTHASVRWTYTFLDMGMQFVIDKAFFVSNEGGVVGDNTSIVATDEAHLRTLVFDHYRSYVANLRHLDCIMEELEPMEQ